MQVDIDIETIIVLQHFSAKQKKNMIHIVRSSYTTHNGKRAAIKTLLVIALFSLYNLDQIHAQSWGELYHIINNLYQDGNNDNSWHYSINSNDGPGCSSLRFKMCIDGKRLVAERDGETYFYYREQNWQLLTPAEIDDEASRLQHIRQQDVENTRQGLEERCSS